MILSNHFFKAERIDEHTVCITGPGHVNCYLIEGNNRAVLIDGLAGAGSLRAFVRELTDFPVTLVNTHGHLDHIGADFEYGEVYISPKDITLLYDHSGMEKRFDYAGGNRHRPDAAVIRMEDMTVPCPVKTLPLYEGDIFDLGGVSLETIEVPGHTKGTVVFLNRTDRILYAGDACNVSTLLYGAEATSIEEYKESLLHLNEYRQFFDSMVGGHGFGKDPAHMIDEAIELCDEIMAGTDDAVPAKGIQGELCWYAKEKDDHFCRIDGKRANIAYSKDRVYRKQTDQTAPRKL